MESVIEIYATNEEIEHLNMMARIHSIKNKYYSPPINQISKQRFMQKKQIGNRSTITYGLQYTDSITREKERQHKKKLATCAKNRRNRKSKKRKNR